MSLREEKMKKRLSIISSLVISVGFLIVFGIDHTRNNAQQLASSGSDLRVRVSVPKTDFILGETIILNTEVENIGKSNLLLRGADVGSGYVKLFRAGGDLKYLQYAHSGWGTKKTGMITIKAGEVIRSQASMLWNFSPLGRVANLDSVKDNLIVSNLAFDTAGVYQLKAVLVIPGDPQIRVESEPIPIRITEPLADDRKVWDLIKENGDLAYFIQEGELQNENGRRKERLLTIVRKIIREHPESLLAAQVRASLEKYQGKENTSTE